MLSNPSRVKVRITPHQVELIREALQNLVGEPLTHMVRALGMQYFRFGVQRPCKDYNGEEATQADWGIMVGSKSYWQVEGPDGFLLSSDNFPKDQERTDLHAKEFYNRQGTNPLVVLETTVSDDGSHSLLFSEGYRLKVRFPETLGKYEEPWRFMTPTSDFRGHLVLEQFVLRWGFRFPGIRRTTCLAISARRSQILSRPGKRSKQPNWRSPRRWFLKETKFRR